MVMHEFFYGAFRSVRVEANVARADHLRFLVVAFEREDARASGYARRLRRRGRRSGRSTC